MSKETYREILERAKHELTPDERKQLMVDLSAEETQGASPVVRTLYDALAARGLIGCIKDGPPDLSTNPKYMEGFGRDAQ